MGGIAIKRLSLAMVIWGVAMGASLAWAQHERHGVTHDESATGAKLAVQDDPSARVLTVRIGPFHLPARSDHHAVPQAPVMFLTMPFDGWLIAYHPRLTGEASLAVPDRLLHHVAFWHTGRRDFLCPNKPEHIFGAGGEMHDWPAVPGYGYRVQRGDRIRIDTMFHNPTDTDYRNVSLEVKMEYRLADAGGTPLKNLYPAWFDVQQCRDSGYDLKPGKNIHTGELQLRYSGTLLGVSGHLHDYGQQLVLLNAARNEEIARLEPKLDGNGRLLSIPVVSFVDRGGYRLKEGEIVRVTAAYDNPTGKPLPEGAMGIVVGYFVPENDPAMAALRREGE